MVVGSYGGTNILVLLLFLHHMSSSFLSILVNECYMKRPGQHLARKDLSVCPAGYYCTDCTVVCTVCPAANTVQTVQ